jgi:hypothetical protein
MSGSPLAPSAGDDKVVVALPIPPEEKQRRLMVEIHRLAGLATVDWTFQLTSRADYFTEHFGVSPAEMKTLILARLKDIEKDKVEERRIEERAEKKQKADEKKQKSADKEKKSAEAKKSKAEQKEVERKAKEKQKSFAGIIKLPVDQRDAELTKLAKRLEEDLTALREEFIEFVGDIATPTTSDWSVEPWGEPVATAALLQELIVKIQKHVVVRPHEALAIALWIMLAWVHEDAAHYSPYLVATSAEADEGKSTLIIDVVGRLTPRPFPGGEPTPATVFRVADAHKPTLLFDDVDTLFERKPELASIFKIGYTRGPKIPRSEWVNGFRETVWYNPFTPKACTMIGTNVPLPLHTRCILIKMKRKLPEEKVEKPTADDDEFKDLRRKLKRWSDDNAATLKNAPPPTDFNNREADNWTLQLAIAQLAGSQWRKQALEAAEQLTRTMRKLSWRQLLLLEFQAVFADRKEVTSEDFFAEITADPLSIWRDYNRGTITQRQIAHLLSELEIYPVNIGPKRIRGYRRQDFVDGFARYLPRDPLILSDGRKRK